MGRRNIQFWPPHLYEVGMVITITLPIEEFWQKAFSHLPRVIKIVDDEDRIGTQAAFVLFCFVMKEAQHGPIIQDPPV